MTQREWERLKPQIVATLRDLSIAPGTVCFALLDPVVPDAIHDWIVDDDEALRVLFDLRHGHDNWDAHWQETRLDLAAAIEGGALDIFYEPEMKLYPQYRGAVLYDQEGRPTRIAKVSEPLDGNGTLGQTVVMARSGSTLYEKYLPDYYSLTPPAPCCTHCPEHCPKQETLREAVGAFLNFANDRHDQGGAEDWLQRLEAAYAREA